MISATIEPMGTMLAGQGVDAFYASIEHAKPLSVGSTAGNRPRVHDRPPPASRSPGWRRATSPGLPGTPGCPDSRRKCCQRDRAHGRFGALGRFIEQGWVNLVGGCCGTTPDHIRDAKVARAGSPAGRRPRA
jgi:5-methyltetrahydrofolate--homocysteine methyltransferase